MPFVPPSSSPAALLTDKIVGAAPVADNDEEAVEEVDDTQKLSLYPRDDDDSSAVEEVDTDKGGPAIADEGISTVIRSFPLLSKVAST